MDTTGSRSSRVAPPAVKKGPELQPPNASRRISALLWGEPGVGKTTLAATAPGRKLIYLFDPDGASSLVGIPEDIMVRNVFEEDLNVVLEFKKENPLGIKGYLEDFDTFVFDSLTNITAKTLDYGVSQQTTTSPSQMPSTGAYGSRNVLALALVKNVLAVTSRAHKHVIFTAHQDTTNIAQSDALIRHTSIALGGKLSSQIGPSFSEIWNVRMSDGVKGGRRIMTRSTNKYTPIKTRMFAEKIPDFTWGFDAEDWTAEENKQYRLDTWYAVWNKHNHKLPHPGSKEFLELMKEI